MSALIWVNNVDSPFGNQNWQHLLKVYNSYVASNILIFNGKHLQIPLIILLLDGT